MKVCVATKYGPPNVFKVKQIKKPVPKANEVLVKNYATSVSVSDCRIRGLHGPIKKQIPPRLLFGIRKPRKILGMVLAGVVESIGKKVSKFNVGDQIFAFTALKMGTYAEYTCIPEKGVSCLKPENLSFEEAAAIPFGGLMALFYLRKGNIKKGEKVLVYGASGSNGTMAVQLAKFYGTEVTGVCGPSNLDLVKSLGADHVKDYTKEDFTINGENYDLILDAVGRRKSANLKYDNALSPNGRFITVDLGFPGYLNEDLNLLKDLAVKKEIKPVIDRTYTLDQMSEAHNYVEMGHKRGNVIIKIF